MATTKDDYLQIRIEPAERKALAALAARNDRTMAAEARRAIRAHLEKEGSK